MSTGDQNDILGRLQSYTPRGWFGNWAQAPVITAILTGVANVLATTYLLIQFFRAQMRLDTSLGGWVDLWAQDFLGDSLPRKPYESDSAYIVRIKAYIFQQKVTRPAMQAMLTTLTGTPPVIFEPMRPLDTGCCGANTGVASFCGIARMGSLAAPYSALITVTRPKVSGGSAGALYANAITWSALSTPLSHGYTGSLADETTIATDADIYEAINGCKPLATNIGVAIIN